MGYLLKVSPDEGKVAVEAALHEPAQSRCIGVLTSIAAIAPGPAFSALATAHLHDPDPVIADDAKGALNEIAHPASWWKDGPELIVTLCTDRAVSCHRLAPPQPADVLKE